MPCAAHVSIGKSTAKKAECKSNWEKVLRGMHAVRPVCSHHSYQRYACRAPCMQPPQLSEVCMSCALYAATTVTRAYKAHLRGYLFPRAHLPPPPSFLPRCASPAVGNPSLWQPFPSGSPFLWCPIPVATIPWCHVLHGVLPMVSCLW